jgi:nucleoside-diphosphate-sugar epimerase
MILVTGASGLVGSHLLCELTQEAPIVRALYRSENRKQDTKEIFNFYFKEKADLFFNKIEWIQGDILSLTDLGLMFVDITHVYHCAALVSFHKTDFHRCLQVNREGTANIVNFCLKHKVEKLCYVSSTAALSYNSNGLTDESFKWIPGPEVSGYSISKFAAEKEVWRGIEEGLNAVIINPCVILGPGNWKESSLSIFKSASKGIGFYPSGSNAIVDVRDVVLSMHYLMNAEISSKKFLCTGPNISFKELLEALAIQFNKRAPKIKSPRWLSLVVASFSEVINLILRKRDGLTIESVYSAYKNITYDNRLICETTGVKFHSLSDTLEHAIKGKIERN